MAVLCLYRRTSRKKFAKILNQKIYWHSRGRGVSVFLLAIFGQCTELCRLWRSLGGFKFELRTDNYQSDWRWWRLPVARRVSLVTLCHTTVDFLWLSVNWGQHWDTSDLWHCYCWHLLGVYCMIDLYLYLCHSISSDNNISARPARVERYRIYISRQVIKNADDCWFL